MAKNLAGILADAFRCLLYLKLCQHNWRGPSNHAYICISKAIFISLLLSEPCIKKFCTLVYLMSLSTGLIATYHDIT